MPGQRIGEYQSKGRMGSKGDRNLRNDPSTHSKVEHLARHP